MFLYNFTLICKDGRCVYILSLQKSIVAQVKKGYRPCSERLKSRRCTISANDNIVFLHLGQNFRMNCRIVAFLVPQILNCNKIMEHTIGIEWVGGVNQVLSVYRCEVPLDLPLSAPSRVPRGCRRDLNRTLPPLRDQCRLGDDPNPCLLFRPRIPRFRLSGPLEEFTREKTIPRKHGVCSYFPNQFDAGQINIHPQSRLCLFCQIL